VSIAIMPMPRNSFVDAYIQRCIGGGFAAITIIWYFGHAKGLCSITLNLGACITIVLWSEFALRRF